jgi:hypothetical protein
MIYTAVLPKKALFCQVFAPFFVAGCYIFKPASNFLVYIFGTYNVNKAAILLMDK